MTSITLKELSQSDTAALETLFDRSGEKWNFAVINLNNDIVNLIVDGKEVKLQQEELRVFADVSAVQAVKRRNLTVLLTISSQDELETLIEYPRPKG